MILLYLRHFGTLLGPCPVIGVGDVLLRFRYFDVAGFPQFNQYFDLG